MSESDQARWVGIRPISPEEVLTRYEPPEDGTYIVRCDNANNGGNTLYTVPADTKLFITSVDLCLHATGAGYGQLIHYSSGAGVKYMFFSSYVTTNLPAFFHASFPIAIEAVTGDYIRLISSVAAITAYGGFVGYTRAV